MKFGPVVPITAFLAVCMVVVLAGARAASAEDADGEAPPPTPVVPPGIPVKLEGRSTYRYWGETMTIGTETSEIPYAVLDNQRFKVALLSRKQAPNLLVLRERVRTVRVLKMDPPKSDITVECWPAGADSTTPPLWRIDTKGYDTAVLDHDRHGSMLCVKGGGCCKDVLPDVYYDILTGTRMFASFGEPLRVEMQMPLLRRFVTFTTRDLPEDPGLDGVKRIALVEYGPRPECSRYLVFAPAADTYGEGEIVFLKNGEPYEATKLFASGGGRDKGPEALGGFGIRMTIDHFATGPDGGSAMVEPITIDIPVEADRLAVEKMRANLGVRLEPLLGSGE